ncbi:acyl-CoA thioesterase [Fluviispira multicolorata]|uniref:Acyl-CoA thioesterase n=1 Tax=Fluviispira multicolorata TaxID=2654512 RepID=A0A833N576_9BACT|nr:acyl-CoA thioesterase [Fluviispira multicolorata]KAB8033532.1 acyl-CoA thioesterase [Fluviispira multicolorata]
MDKLKSAQKYEYEIQIKENHLDTFGHVNNAVYLQLCEEARWEIITENGFGIQEIQQLGIGPVILEVNIKFQKELKLREKIKISTQCIAIRGKVLEIQHEIMNEKNEICSIALFTIGIFDTKKRKIISPIPLWYKSIGVEIEEY